MSTVRDYLDDAKSSLINAQRQATRVRDADAIGTIIGRLEALQARMPR
jgi:hypothetical protein